MSAAVARCRNPVTVGLDPRWEQLPAVLTSGGGSASDRAVRAEIYATFCREILDVVHPLVPAVKPQMAFFEQLGPPGMTALANVIAYAHERDLLVILDGKRGDIGSTAEAYADAYLGANSPWQADALTVNPYLGDDSLEPFVTTARQRAAGLFVLVKTSNPGGATFQDLVADNRKLFRHVAEHVEHWAAQSADETGYGAVGAVTGATYVEELGELRQAMPHSWLLVPGYGSQGATAKDVAAAFDSNGQGAVVNNSRGIIFAHARREYAGRFAPDQWQRAVEAATREMIDQLRAETNVGRL
ncbi:MAG TPA: orotidine-5'-phosphate decarboxylase [Pirellulales bacterium]|nr:orotidine-5'-phosphate decarboxylase [Pirellulales bacterium]